MTVDLTTVIVSVITIVPGVLAAYWARGAKRDAKQAKENSAGTLHEVNTNGGMGGPNPTLKDYTKHQMVELERLSVAVGSLEHRFAGLEHAFANETKHNRVMDRALGELYLAHKNEEL